MADKFQEFGNRTQATSFRSFEVEPTSCPSKGNLLRREIDAAAGVSRMAEDEPAPDASLVGRKT